MRRPPDEVFAAVRDTDPDVLDAAELDTLQGRIAELKAWCDAKQVRATRRQRALAAEGRACDPRHTLSGSGRQSSKDAKAASERESVCTSMPGFEDALANGDVSAGHVDAIAKATRGLDDHDRAEFAGEADTLLGEAGDQSVDAFEKNCRDLAKSIRARNNERADIDELERQREQSKVTRWVDQQTGMCKTLIEADPLTDRHLWAAIQRSRKRLRRQRKQTGEAPTSFDRLTVDAIVDAAANSSSSGGSAGSAGSPGRAVGDRIVVHVSLEHLLAGSADRSHNRGVCETDSGVELPVETVRRMACDGEIIPVVLDGRGVVLDEGRAKRLATLEQRIAIEAMHTTCSFPTCQVSVDDCRIHHVDFWERGGTTNLDVMAPVCDTHHRHIHEGGWVVQITPDRVGTWIRPDGTVHWTGSLLDRASVAA
jgi:hypothetical protein